MTSGLDWRRLIGEAKVNPMVPKGYIELRDSAGKLLRRQWIGTDRKVSNDAASGEQAE